MSHQAIIAGQRQATLERIVGQKQALLLQDTTSFDFGHHPATAGLGPLENEHGQGFLAPSSLTASTEGLPLGLRQQQVWVRDASQTGKSEDRHRRSLETKESDKWIVALQASAGAATEVELVTVADREADIYDFFDAALSADIPFRVRARQDRVLQSQGRRLSEVVEVLAVEATFSLEVTDPSQRQGPTAQMELRFTTVTLVRPKGSTAVRVSLTVGVIEVKEVNPPAGETAIRWLLLTSLPLESVEQARTYVRWYRDRWLMERFHYLLKAAANSKRVRCVRRNGWNACWPCSVWSPGACSGSPTRPD